MTQTNVGSASARQRNPLEFSLLPAEERRRDEILRTAYVRIGEASDCRPEPRRVWDRAADRTEARWRRLLSPIRMAVSAAVLSGDQERLDATLEAADAFLEECKADYRSFVPARKEESIVAIALDETKCEGPANEVQAALLADPSPTSAERAVLPLDRQWRQLGELVEKCRRVARQTRPQMATRLGQQ